MDYSFRQWIEYAKEISENTGFPASSYENIPFYIKWPLLYPFYLFQKHILGVVIKTESEDNTNGKDKEN